MKSSTKPGHSLVEVKHIRRPVPLEQIHRFLADIERWRESKQTLVAFRDLRNFGSDGDGTSGW